LAPSILLILLCAAGSQAQMVRAAEWPQSGGLASAPLDNTPPTASFTIDPPAGYVGTYFTFEGSGSSDLEDDIGYLQARYDWEDDGYYDTAWVLAPVAIDHAYDTPGLKTARMLLQDTDGATDTTTRTVQVDDPGSNTPPTARCVVTPTVGTVETVFSISAATSSDEQDPLSALVVRWDWWGSGHWATDWLPASEVHERQWTRIGVFDARLRVRDSGLLSDDTICYVEINTGQPNQPPTASFVISPTVGDTTTLFSFDSSGCSDGEDELIALSVRYDWEDDGYYDTSWRLAGTLQQHRFAHPGRHTVRMVVQDSGDLTDETTRTVDVAWDPNARLLFLPAILRVR
jgi:hypothetical protein